MFCRIYSDKYVYFETGPGRMLTMMEFLQRECDRQARKILEYFKKNREFDMKAQQVQQALMFQKATTTEK